VFTATERADARKTGGGFTLRASFCAYLAIGAARAAFAAFRGFGGGLSLECIHGV